MPELVSGPRKTAVPGAMSWPALDPESASPWQDFPGNLADDGRPGRLGLETPPRAGSFGPPAREKLLADRPFAAEDIDVPTRVGNLALTVFTPKEPKPQAPGIYWIHGGGMAAGDRLDASNALDLAQANGAVVIAPEYRLAPEHPSPAPLDDCHAGLLWFAAHAEELGVDHTRIVLVGSSAGGGLAAATALRIRDEGGPRIGGLILLSPMLDDRMTTPSSHQFIHGVPWTRTSNEFEWRSLLGERAGTEDVSIYEAPGRAKDLAGLPPAFIDVGSADLLRDEVVAFASTVWACGGSAELHVWPGGYHGFEQWAPESTLAVNAVAARERWFDRLLSALR